MGNIVTKASFQTINRVPERGDVFFADLSGIEKSVG